MLSDTELTALLQGRYKDADSATTFVQKERRDAMQRYNCEPYGDEVKGQSQFITSDVRDDIEWLLPQVIEPFVEGENAVEFTAQNAQDVAQAALETAYIRDVLFQQNPGFVTLYSWAKDGLLLKNGIVKSWWDDRVEEKQEDFKDRDFLFYQQLVNNEAYTIDQVTITVGDEEYDLDSALDELEPEKIAYAKFDIKATKSTDKSQVCYAAIPPENFVVEAGWNSVDLTDVPYCCHRDVVKAWQLIADGHSNKMVDGIQSSDENAIDDENVERFRDDGGIRNTGSSTTENDKNNRDITVYEHYIFADLGDGKPVLRMIKTAGSAGDTILSNEVVDEVPFSVWTPTINPHKHYGLSTADFGIDKQLLKTNLVRRTLDSLYHSIYSGKAVQEKYVYKEDLLNTGPGAIYRIRDGGTPDAIREIGTTFVGQQALPVISMVDEMRANSTGVSGQSQALDMNALANSTNLVGPMVMSQNLARVKMVLRTFAETGFKDLMRRVHSLCRMYDRERMFQYQGQFVTVSPQNWNERSEFTVRVGVGYVEKMARMQAIGTIIGNQTGILASAGFDNPLVSPVEYGNALLEQAKLAGYTDAQKFYKDATGWQPPPPPENPLDQAVEVQKATAIGDLHKAAADNQVRLQLAQIQDAFNRDKLQQDNDLAREELLLKYGQAITKGVDDKQQAVAAPKATGGVAMIPADDPNVLHARIQTLAQNAVDKHAQDQQDAQQHAEKMAVDVATAHAEAERSGMMLQRLDKLDQSVDRLAATVAAPKVVNIQRDAEGRLASTVITTHAN